MRFPGIRLLVFAKAPEPGMVKTRLLPVLDAQQAADLHARLVEESLRRFTTAALCPVQLYCAPDAGHPFFEDLSRRFPIECLPQEGADLGERMANAAARTFAAGHWPVLVGTDCPVLDEVILAQACQALSEGQAAVLTPAEDGGYVLLGLRREATDLFAGMDWGTDRVLVRTRQVLGELGWSWRELPCLWDLDRPDDLDRYRRLAGALV